jgi:ATP-dependent DNA helicase RecG
LRKELSIFNFGDLLQFYPLRHIDKTKVESIASLSPSKDFAYVAGKVKSAELLGTGRAKRFVVEVHDNTGVCELVWFQGINYIQKNIFVGSQYLAFGKLSFFMGLPQIAHPEVEAFTAEKMQGKSTLEPIYPSTEKVKAKGITANVFKKFTQELFQRITKADILENLPKLILEKYKLVDRYIAFQQMHFPQSEQYYQQALRRLKFEEFFFAQIRMQLVKIDRHRFSKGNIFENVSTHFNDFYNNHLPFTLTSAQKNVLKQIRKDVGSGKQMNRLLQGDVGSGKTIVALLAILIGIDNGYQAVLMAPTEILATQHFNGITELLKNMPIQVELLTGSTKQKDRKRILAATESGELQILIGTHAVIEDKVQFKNLGLAIVDEQHKFGVAQRAQLRNKNTITPHILVMTATPIPRTLALTAYGDLDYSVMDELPPGRKPIETAHKFENNRLAVMDFIKTEIALGRQVYVVYPLIQESSTLDFENLMKGYEEVKSFFPEPKYWISMVHGKQPPEQKDANMQRFVKGETQIMVSTTVIEVGVNVPNASVMVIESAERFGLSQLHQLRGRVGRGAEKSYCILLTGKKLSQEGKQRMAIMTATNDGFLVAEKDLELRGPGEIEGTRQSGALEFKLVSITQDRNILEVAKTEVENLLEADPDLQQEPNLPIKQYLQLQKGKTAWSKIA